MIKEKWQITYTQDQGDTMFNLANGYFPMQNPYMSFNPYFMQNNVPFFCSMPYHAHFDFDYSYQGYMFLEGIDLREFLLTPMDPNSNGYQKLM